MSKEGGLGKAVSFPVFGDHLKSSVCPPASAEGDAEDVPAENPAERERSSAAERDRGVSEGESREEEKFVSVSVQTH